MRNLLRIARAISEAVRSPADALLLMQIAVFIARLPDSVRRSNVGVFFARLESAPRPRSATIEESYTRIARLRSACLSLPRLWRRDTCYIRAFTLLRFLDPGTHRLRVHFGVEQPLVDGDRLRGHAWVSVNERPFEAPEAVYHGRVRELPIDGAF
jgi:hypothetical protein